MHPRAIASKTVGIVADDVTGATDSIVQFSRKGWPSRLQLHPHGSHPLPEGSAVAISSDARPLDPDSTRRETARAVHQLMHLGAGRLYLKIDSTMRGNVADQVAGGIEAWRETHPGSFAVVCPAYPPMGRTVENGLLRVHGQPVKDSDAGADPVTPVRSSRVSTLLRGIRTVSLTGGSSAAHARLLRDAAAGVAVAVNASTEADLAVLAEALMEAGPDAVPAGSAGLAIAMAGAWAPGGCPGRDDRPRPPRPAQRVIILVSSVHHVALAQTEHLISRLDPAALSVLQPSAAVLQDESLLTAWTGDQLSSGAASASILLVLSPDLGPSVSLSGASVARRLAGIVRAAAEQHGTDGFVLVGGDGAHAVLAALGASALTVTGAVQEGVPHGVIEGGAAAGRFVVTKAGGFGDPSALLETLKNLTNHTALSSEATP